MLAGHHDNAPHLHLGDAKSRRDPTGTLPIRSAFRQQAERRMQRIKNHIRDALIQRNLLGLPSDAPVQQVMAPVSRAQVFHEWFNSTVYRELVESDAAWTRNYVKLAWDKGNHDARKDIGGDPPSEVTQWDMAGIYAQMAVGELQGIADALVQVGNRLATDAVARRMRPVPLTRLFVSTINKQTRNRVFALANTLPVRVYNDSLLAKYRSSGINQVGVLAEFLPPPKRIKAKDAETFYSAGERVPVSEVGIGSVELQTAEDDLVCDECEDLQANGPFLVTEVFGVLPLHINCRCRWLPYGHPELDED